MVYLFRTTRISAFLREFSWQKLLRLTFLVLIASLIEQSAVKSSVGIVPIGNSADILAYATSVTSGGTHNCALTSNGGVKCWGSNHLGELGDGTTTNRSIPVDVIGLSSGVAAISSGSGHTCALTSSGDVKCWGFNVSGSLGDGTTTNRSTPTNVIGLSSVVTSIATSSVHTCALTSGGGVKCWGSNLWGELGDGSNSSQRNTPDDDVIGLTSGVTAIAAGGGSTCASINGGVKCWGFNNWGQIGDGTTIDRNTPVDVVGLTTNIAAVTVGEFHACAQTTAGGVKCWGFNAGGQIGDGTTIDRTIPVNVTGLSDKITSIAAGLTHTCARTSSGGVKCWGSNGSGQLGDGTTANKSLPVDVVGFGGDTYSISGRVTDKEGIPVPNVTISAGSFGSSITDANGAYTLSKLEPGMYTLTPSFPNYEFSPASRTATVPLSATGQDFVRSGKPAIVFVHGWNGFSPNFTECNSSYKFKRTDDQFSDRYFKEIDNYLKQDYAVFYAHLISWSCWTPPINENVQYLREAIEDAKNKTGRSKVTLIAHSMGGIISRVYLEGPNYRNRTDVEALFTLGTPHQGIPVEKMVEGLLGPIFGSIGLGIYCKQYQPAVCDFSIQGMSWFNQKYAKRAPGVTYHVISGDAPLFTRNALGMIMAAMIPGGDDGIVPYASGTNLQYNPNDSLSRVDDLTTDEVHDYHLGGNSYFARTATTGSHSYFACLSPILVNKTKQNCSEITGSDNTAPGSVDLNAQAPSQYGTLLANQPVTRTIVLDAGAAIFGAQWQNGEVEFTLIDPSNQVIDFSYAITHPDTVIYNKDETASTYYFPNALAGTWKMVLKANSKVPSDSITYTTFVAFDSPFQLVTGIDKQWYLPTSTAIITASLTNLPISATVTAAILDSNNLTQIIQLTALGDGKYRGMYPVPDVPGYAEVRLVAEGVTMEGVPFERAEVLSFQISPQSAKLTGIYHEVPQPRLSGSSFHEALDIIAGINVMMEGTFGLSADLLDLAGNFVAHSFTIQNLTTQTSTISLRFDGTDINISEKNGPYIMTNLLFTDQNEMTLVLTEAKNVYQTAAYNYHIFGNGNIYLPLIQND